MIALGPRSRAALGVASLASFAAAFALAPLGPRGAADARVRTVALTASRSPAARTVAVVPVRDPFSGGASPKPSPTSVTALAPIPAVPGPLPANVGAAEASAAIAPASVRVTAIATGAHPSALVSDGATVRLIGLGDRIAGATVAAIDAGGLHLSDRTTLALDPAPAAVHPQPPSVRTPPPAIQRAASPLPMTSGGPP